MKGLNKILILIFILLGEMHKLFSNAKGTVSPFLFSEVQLHPQWVAKNVGEMLQFCIISYIALSLSKRIAGIGDLRLMLKAIFFFGILDFIFYFLTYKHGYYGLVYLFIMALVWYIQFGRKRRVV